MFPLNSNMSYIKDNGERDKLGNVIGSGGSSLPEYSSSDSGKVLTVNEDGELEWDDKGGGVVVLTGTTDPSNSQGENGNMYLKYEDISLPEGYTLLDYLATGSTAGAYINTEVEQKPTSYFDIDVSYSGTPGNDNWAFGTGSGPDTNEIGYYSGNIYFFIKNTGYQAPFDTQKHNYRYAADGCYVDGSRVNTNVGVARSGYKYFLFARGNTSDAAQNPTTNCRIHKCSIYDGETLVRQFLPAKRLSDNALGMYDLVNDVFYTNDGSQSFVAGPDKSGSKPITDQYLKVNGVWKPLDTCSIDDLN